MQKCENWDIESTLVQCPVEWGLVDSNEYIGLVYSIVDALKVKG